RHHHGAIEALHHPAQQRRLAGADFAGHDDQAAATLDAVVQVRHHFRVRRRKVEVARIGRQREWQLFESVKFYVHRFLRWYAVPTLRDCFFARQRRAVPTARSFQTRASAKGRMPAWVPQQLTLRCRRPKPNSDVAEPRALRPASAIQESKRALATPCSASRLQSFEW